MSLEDLDSLSFHGSFRSSLSHFKHLRMNGLVERVFAVGTCSSLIDEVALSLAERWLQIQRSALGLEWVIWLPHSVHVHIQCFKRVVSFNGNIVSLSHIPISGCSVKESPSSRWVLSGSHWFLRVVDALSRVRNRHWHVSVSRTQFLQLWAQIALVELSRAVQRGDHIEVEVPELSHAHWVQGRFSGALILEGGHSSVLFGVWHFLLTVHIE